jgi:hypothetical protein
MACTSWWSFVGHTNFSSIFVLLKESEIQLHRVTQRRHKGHKEIHGEFTLCVNYGIDFRLAAILLLCMRSQREMAGRKEEHFVEVQHMQALMTVRDCAP